MREHLNITTIKHISPLQFADPSLRPMVGKIQISEVALLPAHWSYRQHSSLLLKMPSESNSQHVSG